MIARKKQTVRTRTKCLGCRNPIEEDRPVAARFCRPCIRKRKRETEDKLREFRRQLRASSGWVDGRSCRPIRESREIEDQKPADKPTTAPPGTASKIKILAARVANNETLWHPMDVDFSGD